MSNKAMTKLNGHTFFKRFVYFTSLEEDEDNIKPSRWSTLVLGGTRTCVHPHVSCTLYHCAMDAAYFYTYHHLASQGFHSYDCISSLSDTN